MHLDYRAISAPKPKKSTKKKSFIWEWK